MAKNMQPIAKRCRALGLSPAVMGYSKKTSNRNPGGKMRRKKSEYSMQLTEKQKVKFIYGILEKQFRAYYEKAEKAEGKTGEALLSLVERRLDNVVFRLGLASTRREARELVKISVLDNCGLDVRGIAETVSARTKSDVVQVIGNKIIFYRRSKKKQIIEF